MDFATLNLAVVTSRQCYCHVANLEEPWEASANAECGFPISYWYEWQGAYHTNSPKTILIPYWLPGTILGVGSEI